MTTEIQTQPQESDAISNHYLFEKRLHKTCRGVLKEKGNLYSIRYICSNPACPCYNRIVLLDEIVLTFEEIKRIDDEETTGEIVVEKEKPKQQLRFSLLLGQKSMDLDTFWYRWFFFEVAKCIKCKGLIIDWKEGLAKAECATRDCKFRERWDI